MHDTTAVWDRIAGFWDDHLGEGNAFQKQLIMPTTDRLLGDVNERRVLDACCGNGNYARLLAARGARVTAFDGSAVFIDRARARTKVFTNALTNALAPRGLSIDYRVIDATDAAALATLGEAASFDRVVCSMAMMDLADVAPLLRAARRLLTPAGAFVFSVCHPCFNATGVRMTADLVTEEGKQRQRFGVATGTYLTPRTDASEGIINQPEPHPMFHRPISGLLRECFAAGFVVDAFEEPAFAPGMASKSVFSWAKRPEIPPALVVRLIVSPPGTL